MVRCVSYWSHTPVSVHVSGPLARNGVTPAYHLRQLLSRCLRLFGVVAGERAESCSQSAHKMLPVPVHQPDLQPPPAANPTRLSRPRWGSSHSPRGGSSQSPRAVASSQSPRNVSSQSPRGMSSQSPRGMLTATPMSRNRHAASGLGSRPISVNERPPVGRWSLHQPQRQQPLLAASTVAPVAVHSSDELLRWEEWLAAEEHAVRQALAKRGAAPRS